MSHDGGTSGRRFATPRSGLVGWIAGVPGVRLARSYRREDLIPDLVAGLVLATMLVPQGMAYAELTGLPAVTGLYTTVAALLAYVAFGPSRILVLGPDSSLAPLIAAVVLPLAAGDDAVAVALAATLGVITGLVCLVAGWARLGMITELLSRPVRIGYLNGIAVIVFVSQLPKMLGFSVDGNDVIDTTVQTVSGVADGLGRPVPLLVAVGALGVILGFRRWMPRIPGVLVAAVASILAVALFDLTRLGVSVVGELPTGIPELSLPDLDGSTLVPLLVGALGIALVSFADTGALSTAFALRSGQRVDPNREIRALGAANILAGLFQGFPTSASSSRTAVASAVGSRTQLTGLIAAAGVVGLLGFAPDLLARLPSPTLAAIVVAASFALFDREGVAWLWKVRRSEFWLSAGAFLAVVVIGVLEGIAVAIGLSVANFIRRAWHPYSAVLARVDGLKGYHDLSRHPDGHQIPGLLLFRFDAPIFFANAAHFGRLIQAELGQSRGTQTVVMAAEPITDIDTTGAEVVSMLLDDLDRKGIAFGFAELKGPVKDRLRRYGLYDRIGEDNFFPTVGSAVRHHVETTGVPWIDWEEA